MSSLTGVEKLRLEKLLQMSGGYVLDLTNRTFAGVVKGATGVDIYEEDYASGGGSKANRLRTFWERESDEMVAQLLGALLEYAKELGLDAAQIDSCDRVVARLRATEAAPVGLEGPASPMASHPQAATPQSQASPSGEAITVRPTVITIHGIRTRGAWQKSLQRALDSAGFAHAPLDFGFLGVVRLLWPGSRRRRVEWFREEYTREARGGRPSIIAHSFGTYLLARALELYPEIKVDRVVLCGSIIRRSYEWSHMVTVTNQVNAVLNDYGRRDLWAAIVGLVVEDAGPSGSQGFLDLADGAVVQREHPEWRHSDYFYELNYRDSWVPFLKGLRSPLAAVPRRPRNWRPLLVGFCLLMLVGMALRALGPWSPWGPWRPTSNPSAFPLAAGSDLRRLACDNPPPTPEGSPPLECVREPPQWTQSGIRNLSLLTKATAAASSVYSVNNYHRTEYLNDGWYNNGRSWVADGVNGAGTCSFPQWAQITLDTDHEIVAVALTNEFSFSHHDRGVTDLVIETSDLQGTQSTFATLRGGNPLRGRVEFGGVPVRASRVRVIIKAVENGACPRLDEIEVLGKP